MRRNDREVKEMGDLLQIMDRCKVCRIAMRDGDSLYIVPMNFGYTFENEVITLVFHSAKAGRKLDALRKNNEVAFEMDCEGRLITADTACEYGYAFESVLGNGQVSFLDDVEEKKRALSVLMKHQTGQEFTFEDAMTESVCVFAITVREMTGKRKQ